MATNWNTLLASITNAADILAILKKILPLLDGKVDSTAIDELLAQLNKVAEDGKITIKEALEKVDFLDQRIDERTNAFDDAIAAAAAAGAGANGWTDLLIQTEDGSNQRLLNQKTLKNGEYGPLLGSPVKLKLNPIMASFLYGISDPTHKDDNLNIFRGLNNPDAWHDSNIAIGGFGIGRNNVPFAYLGNAFGHDCIAYGVASLVGGAGSCTGNPDVPSDGTFYGYCSFAWGKDTQARRRISNAMGHLCLSDGMYSSTDGYKSIAGGTQPSHPDYDLYGGDGADGTSSRAHGYQAEAYGNFAFSYGSFIQAFNGAQAIGRGLLQNGNVKPLRVSKRGLGLGYNVSKPTIFCKEGNGIEADGAWIGFNNDVPMSRYDFRYGESDTVTNVIESISGNGILANEVKGLMGDGTYKSLHNIIVTHPNAGQPYGIVQFRLNGVEYLTVDVTRKASFAREIETTAGLIVAGDRVVGGQMPAIADLPPSATLEDVIATVNTMLAALRAGTGHGLIAK